MMPNPAGCMSESHLGGTIVPSRTLAVNEEVTQVDDKGAALRDILGLMFRAHPWHGVSIGPEAPETVNVYIEIVPTDTVKYELDKDSGILKVDRPQKYSNICPTPYGFIPQTLCAERVAERTVERTGRDDVVGDGDPLDICVLTEKHFAHGDFLLHAIPIGGFRMLDGNEADDKIIAVMQQDAVYGAWNDLKSVPVSTIERLRHYFLTYKDAPGTAQRKSEITHVYGRAEAHDIIRRSQEDYRARFGRIGDRLPKLVRGEAPAVASDPFEPLSALG
jgi:inorganic pyrophosphatase